MRNGIALLLSACLFLGIAHAENNAAPEAAAQADGIPQRGTLYRVRHGDNSAYLFGTVHVGRPTFYPLEATVTHALSGASKLVLEIDTRRHESIQLALQKHGMYGGIDVIDNHIAAATLAQLKQTLQRFRLTFESVRRLKPWVVANMLVSLDLERAGYQRQHGIETFLLSLAERQSKAVQELESAEYQMSLFDGMSSTLQEAYLRETLAALDDGDALKKAQALIDAWANADGEAVEKLMNESLLEKTVSADFVNQVLLQRRNPEMANEIETLLKHERSTFIGIGLLHLVGKAGVPTLLRQRGYEVEKLY